MSCGNANYLGPDSCGFTGCRYEIRCSVQCPLGFPHVEIDRAENSNPPRFTNTKATSIRNKSHVSSITQD